MKEEYKKKIKRLIAWLFVLLVGYVTLYAYLHPEEIVYREDVYNNLLSAEIEEIPTEPLIKQTNPFVYFILQYQAYIVGAIMLYLILDFKHTKKVIKKIVSKFESLENV